MDERNKNLLVRGHKFMKHYRTTGSNTISCSSDGYSTSNENHRGSCLTNTAAMVLSFSTPAISTTTQHIIQLLRIT